MLYNGKDLGLRDYFEAVVNDNRHREVDSETAYDIIADYYSSCEYKSEDNEFLSEHGYLYTDFTEDGKYKFHDFQQTEEYIVADIVYVIDGESGEEIEEWDDDMLSDFTVEGWRWTEPVGVGGELEITVMRTV